MVWIGARCEGEVVAALTYQLIHDLCDIGRLVVSPEHFGRGYASALVASLLGHRRITVTTGAANTPARRLYEKHGFQPVGERSIAPCVTVTQYERRVWYSPLNYRAHLAEYHLGRVVTGRAGDLAAGVSACAAKV
ncbi:hypothetical protein BH23CHL2_BH23CHL2_11560 [soil metagenome]